jgi:poly(A) polymerase
MSDQQAATLPTLYPRDEHCLSKANIDPDALRIISRLEQFGHKAYIVGGGVRDLLLLKEPKDFDLVTDATPKKIKSLFRNSRVIGRRFKLVHIFFSGGKNIEIATFRDLSDDFESEEGEEADKFVENNRFGNEATDAFRRDLTINGLYYDVSRSLIIDYVGGFEDLQNGIIRVIGEPTLRFREDPVRMMRVVRHAARCGFSIEESCREALLSCRELLFEAPPMRIFEEFKKDLVSGYSAPTLHLLQEMSLLSLLLPTLANTEYFRLRHPFSVGLRRLDVLCRESAPPPLSSVLAFCLLHGLGNDLADAATLFSKYENIQTQIRYTFAHLSVPRRERERVTEVLQLWSQLERTNTERRSPQKIQRRACLEDLYSFVCLVEGPESESPLLDIIRKAMDFRIGSGQEEDSRAQRSSGRQRNPRPRSASRRRHHRNGEES